jgi:hypothetical protein
MASKTLKTRILMKNDTAENWDVSSQNGFIPLLGEPIFYKDNNDTMYGVKLGNGKNTPNDLPFLHGMISKNNTTVLTNQDLQILFAQEGSKFLKSSEFSTAGAGEEFISLVDLNVNKTYSAFGQFGEFGLLFYNDGEW